MPDYSIDGSQYPESECAFCGGPYRVDAHIRNADRGGVTTIPSCVSCNSSMRSSTLKSWLRRLKDLDSDKWYDIVEHQGWRRTGLARLVREVRDE